MTLTYLLEKQFPSGVMKTLLSSYRPPQAVMATRIVIIRVFQLPSSSP